MESIRFVCPHCGLKMEATLQGKPSLLMVFVCARCKEPLMRFDGEVFELDREEFVNLRKKLSPVIGQLLKQETPAENQETMPAEMHASVRPLQKSLIDDTFMQELLANLESCKDVSEFIDKM